MAVLACAAWHMRSRHELTAHAGQVFQSKRKPMDMKEQRISSELGAGGTFGAPPPLPPKGKKGVRAAAPSPAEPPAAARKAVPKWKAQSGQLRAAMAAARGDLPFDAPPVVDEVSCGDVVLSGAWRYLPWNVLTEGQMVSLAGLPLPTTTKQTQGSRLCRGAADDSSLPVLLCSPWYRVRTAGGASMPSRLSGTYPSARTSAQSQPGCLPRDGRADADGGTRHTQLPACCLLTWLLQLDSLVDDYTYSYWLFVRLL